MTLQLGRLALPDDTVDVNAARHGGGLRVDCRAWLIPHHPLRRQLDGMVDQLIGVSWAHDRTWAGFYRAGRVSADVVHLDDRAQVVDFSIDLDPVLSGQVDFESSIIGAPMVNVHGLTGGTPWLATPAGVDDLRAARPGDPLPTRLSRASADGPVRVWLGAPPHTLWSPLADPAAWYDGAAEIRQNLAVVTGDRVVDPPGLFEMSNGLCRIRWIIGEEDLTWGELTGTWDDFGDLTWGDLDGLDDLEISTWNGTSWVRKLWDLGFTPTVCAVLRNDPWACSVRLVQPLSPGGETVDLTLRRGAQTVHVHARGPVKTRAVTRAEPEAATQITGGITATNPTDGVRYVAATVHAFTVDPDGGISRDGDADRMTFMVGGSTSDDVDRSPADLVGQWIDHADEDVQAVPR